MLQSRLMRVRCSAMGRFAQNESEMSESNESLGSRGCRTNRELALLRTTRDSTSSHFKHLNKPTVKLGLNSQATSPTRLRLYESAIASRFRFSRKICSPATLEFCNKIGPTRKSSDVRFPPLLEAERTSVRRPFNEYAAYSSLRALCAGAVASRVETGSFD